MKTAISIPDDTFEAAEKRAHEAGMSRSEFFTTAVRRYLAELDRSSITEQMDEALSRITPDDSASAAVVASRARLTAGDDW